MMTASTKTFNIAGAHVGNVVISDGWAAREIREADARLWHVAQCIRHAHGHGGLLAGRGGMGGWARRLSGG